MFLLIVTLVFAAVTVEQVDGDRIQGPFEMWWGAEKKVENMYLV